MSQLRWNTALERILSHEFGAITHIGAGGRLEVIGQIRPGDRICVGHTTGLCVRIDSGGQPVLKFSQPSTLGKLLSALLVKLRSPVAIESTIPRAAWLAVGLAGGAAAWSVLL